MAVWSNVNTQEIAKFRRIDGEFFHPKYIQAEDIIHRYNNVKSLGKLGDFLIGPFGSAFHVSNYDDKSCYRYVRGKDVKPFSLLNDDNVYMPEKDYKRLQKYALQEEDLLISVVGTLGNVAIVPEDVKGIFSCKSTVFRNSKVDPYFLLAYFNSTYGRECLLRRQRGAIQTGLNKEDLKTVPVPLLPNDEQYTIGKNVKHALKLLISSNAFYAQAQEILEGELGLNKIKFEKPLSYEAKLSEVVGYNRADADYYQIPFKILEKHLKTIKTKPLRQIADLIKGIEVGSKAYSDDGIPFLRVSNIKEMGISLGNSDKYIGDHIYTSLKAYQPQVGELLLTKDGTPGVCYAVTEPIKGIVSSGIMRLVLKDNNTPLEYLALVINSKVCRMQIEQECSGALIVHWKPGSIKKLKIPVLPEATMKKMDRLVKDSKKAKMQSQQLIEQAKCRVEELIEQAVQ